MRLNIIIRCNDGAAAIAFEAGGTVMGVPFTCYNVRTRIVL